MCDVAALSSGAADVGLLLAAGLLLAGDAAAVTVDILMCREGLQQCREKSSEPVYTRSASSILHVHVNNLPCCCL